MAFNWKHTKANCLFRTTMIVMAFSTAFGLFVPVSDAQAQNTKNPLKAVEKRDADGDGKVSPEEWDKSASNFKKIDKDGDGFLSPEDFSKHWRSSGKPASKGAKKRGTLKGKEAVQKAKELTDQSDIAFKSNRGEQSLDLIRQAAELIKRTKASANLVQKIYYILGKREFAAGNAVSAIKAVSKAVKAKPGPSNLADLVLYNLNVGRVKKAEFFATKAHTAATQELKQPSLPEWKRLTIARDIAIMDSTLLQKQGLWPDAEPKLRDALAVGEKLVALDPKWRLGFLKLKWSLASNLLKQDRAVEAEIIAREGFNDARTKAKEAIGFAAILVRFIGEALLAQGRLSEAQEMAEQSLRLISDSGEPPSSRKSVLAKRFLGSVLALQGDWQGADEQFIQAGKELGKNQRTKRSLLDNYPFVTLTAIKRGRGSDYRKGLEKRLSKLQKRYGDQHPTTAQTRALLAMIRAQMGEKDAALKDMMQAVPVLLSGTPTADADEDSSKSYQAIIKREILESYLGLLADAHASKIAPVAGLDLVDTAFRIADIARGSIVQKALAASGARAVVKNKELSTLVRTGQDARKSITALNQLLAGALGRAEAEQDPDAIDDLRAKIEKTRKNRLSAISEVEKRFPEYARLINPKPATLAEARATLQPGEALIATYFAPERSYAWAVNADGETEFMSVNISVDDIADTISDLRLALDPGGSGLNGVPKFDIDAAYRLYATFFKPLEAVWKKAENLLLVAHGPLGSLPISVLPTKPVPQPPEQTVPFANYKNVPWLAKTHSVTLIPSVSALTALRRLPAPSPDRLPFVGFGDPYFSKDQEKSALQLVAANSAQQSGIKTRGVAMILRSVLRGSGLETGELERLPRLPDTASELTSIANVLGNGTTKTVYLGADASESRVKSMDLSKYRVITFATHGLVPGDLKGLIQPALAMSAPQVTGDDDDGLLTMEEILNLKLDADWVILSACNTATGDGAGAEAVSGLGQAFFYAGTRSLLASNWPVETVSAKVLTTGIFRLQQKNPSLTKAQALRLSMVKIMETGEAKDPGTGKTLYSYAHPIFWAPFSLIGDGR